jgi:hypothetical protein
MALVPSTRGSLFSFDGLVPAVLLLTVVFVPGFVVDGRLRFRPADLALVSRVSASS